MAANTRTLNLPVFSQSGIGKPWVLECLEVYRPGAKTGRFINPGAPFSEPGRFQLPIGSVCYVHQPYQDCDGTLTYTRYHLLVEAGGFTRLSQWAANRLIERNATPATPFAYPVSDDADWAETL